MTKMRWAVLAAGVAAAALSASAAAAPAGAPAPAPTTASHADTVQVPAAILRATAPPNADPARTYADPSAALLQADLDYLVRDARRELAQSDNNPIWPVLAFSDDFAQGHLAEARRSLEAAQGGVQGGTGDLLEPFLLVAENHVDRALERVNASNDDLPAPLPDVQHALVLEAAGRLNDAAAVYSAMEHRLDLRPPPDSEPTTPEEFQRALSATRITHAMYRAALVQQRLGHADEARRLYGIVNQFAPNSADVEANLARLGHGQPPLEAPLTPVTAAGRWMLFLSEYLTQTEGLAQALQQRTPTAGLSSASGSLFLQLGVALAADSQDWRIYAAQQLVNANGLDGAQRVIDLVPADSVFAPDAELVKANIQLQRHNDEAAVAAANRAVQIGGQRWSVVASAGDVYRSAGHVPQAVEAFSRALTMTQVPKDRANILGWRAYAHRFVGEYAAASADMRQAVQLNPTPNTRMLSVSILMDDPQAWQEGVQTARGLLAEDPNSVSRLNALGYALIQHPEGLEEGFRLLWRGFNFGQTDYAVVDSLGWAYYQYGNFDEARALCERARDLSVADPNFEILDHLGDIYWRLNRRDDARASWRAAIEARPDLPRKHNIEQKIAHGMSEPAPQRRTPPQVNLPQNPATRTET